MLIPEKLGQHIFGKFGPCGTGRVSAGIGTEARSRPGSDIFAAGRPSRLRVNPSQLRVNKYSPHPLRSLRSLHSILPDRSIMAAGVREKKEMQGETRSARRDAESTEKIGEMQSQII